MSKGDHVFNNVVAKLLKSFAAGLEGLRETRAASSSARAWRDQALPEPWLRQYMPRTLAALAYFQHHPELVVLRNQLQTTDFLGDDVNTVAYSSAATQFDSEVTRFFQKLATLTTPQSGNAMLSQIAAVRRCFFHLTRAAEDPNAQRRLLAEYRPQSREQRQVEAHIAKVRSSMDWGWARCEYLFRTVTAETLALPR